ncbi:MAG: SurA N-terminal domain-containing protein [Bacteroidales bacterium]|nr:SurA N-terminal domain-containing protein [Bacteroidales bacterium]
MATLEKMRSKAGLLVGVVGVALFAFVIGDFLNSGSGFWRESQEVIGKVDGEKFTVFEYEERVQEMTDVYKIQYGDGNINEEISGQIRKSVWDEMVNERLFGAETEKIGMTVTPEELFDMVNGDEVYPLIQQMPMFRNPNTGQFDKDALLNFLQTIQATDLTQYGAEGAQQIAQYKKYWLFYEKLIKKARLSEKYGSLFAKAMSVNELEGESSLKDRSLSVDFLYAVQPYTSIPDSTIKINDSDVEKLYKSRLDRYKTLPYRTVKFMAVDIRPSESDFKEVEDKINKAKAEFETTSDVAAVVAENSDVPYIDAFVPYTQLDAQTLAFVQSATPGAVQGPTFANDTYTMMRLMGTTTAADSLKLRHIYLQRADEASTNALADSLMNVLKNGGDFVALCTQFSLANTKEQAGEIGWMTEVAAVSALGKESAAAIMAAGVNEYIKSSSANGVSIFQVTEKTAPVQKAKVATIAMTVSPSSRTYSKLYNEINQMIATSKGSLDSLESKAAKSGYYFQVDNMVTSETDLIADLKDSRRMVRWAFENEVGAISDIYDCGNRFAVASVTEVNDEGYMPLTNVAPSLKMELIADKKAEKMIADLSAKKFATIADAASAMSSKVDTAKFVTFATRQITGLGAEAALIGAAPASKENAVTGPIKGRNGVYVINVIKKTENPIGDIDAEKKGLNMAIQNRIGYQLVPVMKEKKEVEDFRIRFF